MKTTKAILRSATFVALALLMSVGITFAAVCTSCGGSGNGNLPCITCNGTGMVNGLKCVSCNGRRFNKCPFCNGTGQR